MKLSLALLTAGGLSVALGTTAPAAIVSQSDFVTSGSHDNWTAGGGAIREVSGDGLLRLRTTTNDPQLVLGVANELTRAASSTGWTTFETLARELDEVGGSPVAFDPTGTLLIFNGNNLGAPDTVGAADAGGFQLLTWDISGVASTTSGNIRLDFFGGPGTTGAPNNVGELEFIRVSDNSVIPEPASLALIGVGGLTLMGRRRK